MCVQFEVRCLHSEYSSEHSGTSALNTKWVTVPHEPVNNCVGSDVSGFRVVNRRSFCVCFFFQISVFFVLHKAVLWARRVEGTGRGWARHQRRFRFYLWFRSYDCHSGTVSKGGDGRHQKGIFPPANQSAPSHSQDRLRAKVWWDDCWVHSSSLTHTPVTICHWHLLPVEDERGEDANVMSTWRKSRVIS